MTERDKLITQVALATGMTLYMATMAVDMVEAHVKREAQTDRDNRWYTVEWQPVLGVAIRRLEPRP